MDKRLDKIEEKVDKILDQQSTMNATLVSQHVSISEHIRRTNLLEAEVKPIKRHVDMVNGALKLLGVMLVVFELYKAIK